MTVEHADTGAEGAKEILQRRMQAERGKLLAQILDEAACTAQGTVAEQDDEGFTAITPEKVGTTDTIAQKMGQGAQDHVTDEMTVGGTDILEMIDLQQSNAQGLAIALTALDLGGQAIFDLALGQQPGQPVTRQRLGEQA